MIKTKDLKMDTTPRIICSRCKHPIKHEYVEFKNKGKSATYLCAECIYQCSIM